MPGYSDYDYLLKKDLVEARNREVLDAIRRGTLQGWNARTSHK